MAENPNSAGEFIPEPYPMSPEQKAAAMAKAKAKFSAAGLQRFTEEEEGIPMDEVIATLEGLPSGQSRGGVLVLAISDLRDAGRIRQASAFERFAAFEGFSTLSRNRRKG